MIPSRIFRSRWAALLWAGGVLWFACDVATQTHDEDAGAPANAADIAALANLAAGQ